MCGIKIGESILFLFSKKKSDIGDCAMLTLNTQNYLFTIVVIFFILQVQDMILDLKNKKLQSFVLLVQFLNVLSILYIPHL
jgi:hypothetical protein